MESKTTKVNMSRSGLCKEIDRLRHALQEIESYWDRMGDCTNADEAHYKLANIAREALK